jgi:hypothetical protein
MTPRTQRWLADAAWFFIWTALIATIAWLMGEQRSRVWIEAVLGGLAALGAFRLLT